jgi:NADPH:quinone reductase-like Zn-dependent oxidoreductase
VIEEVPRPEPQAGEVLVRVHAAGVNPVDWKIRRGYLKDFMPVPLPFTPGLDLAGIVAAVGPDVTTVQPGQAVFGRGSGAYAEYAIAPANALAPKPHALSFDQAATIPVGASTAWAAIFVWLVSRPGNASSSMVRLAGSASTRCSSGGGRAPR